MQEACLVEELGGVGVHQQLVQIVCNAPAILDGRYHVPHLCTRYVCLCSSSNAARQGSPGVVAGAQPTAAMGSTVAMRKYEARFEKAADTRRVGSKREPGLLRSTPSPMSALPPSWHPSPAGGSAGQLRGSAVASSLFHSPWRACFPGTAGLVLWCNSTSRGACLAWVITAVTQDGGSPARSGCMRTGRTG